MNSTWIIYVVVGLLSNYVLLIQSPSFQFKCHNFRFIVLSTIINISFLDIKGWH